MMSAPPPRRLTVRSLLLVLVFALAGFTVPAPQAANALPPADFIKWVVPMAQETERIYKVPTSVSIAQAILESGWGESRLTKNANSFFGIKCFARVSPLQNGCYEIATREYNSDGSSYTIIAKFRKYNSPALSFQDHGLFLTTNSRYQPAFSYSNWPERFAFEVHKAGYATDPQYANSLISLMRQYNLTQYDITPRSTAAPTVATRASTTSAVVNSTVNITGLVGPGVSEASVWTQVQIGSTWSTSQIRTTSTRGSFSIPLTYGASTPGTRTFRVQARLANGSVVTSPTFTLARRDAIVSLAAPSSVTVGTSSSVTGRLASGASGRPVSTQAYVGGAWKTDKSGTTGANGAFTLPLSYGVGTLGAQRFRVVATASNGATVTSSEFAVHRTDAITVSAPESVSAIARANATGKVATGASGVPVAVQVKVGSGWSTSQRATTGAGGAFTLPLTYGTGHVGAWTFRVNVVGTNTVSREFTLRRTAAVAINAPAAAAYNTQPTVTGTAMGVGAGATASTQVLLPSGWATSRIADVSSERFSLPVTYGSGTAGSYRYRVAVRPQSGPVLYSSEFVATWVDPITASAPASARVGTTASVTGKLQLGGARQVSSQVWLGDRWSTSQSRTAKADGSFSIPLTYGQSSVGTFRFRVVSANGGVSQEFVIRRTR